MVFPLALLFTVAFQWEKEKSLCEDINIEQLEHSLVLEGSSGRALTGFRWVCGSRVNVDLVKGLCCLRHSLASRWLS